MAGTRLDSKLTITHPTRSLYEWTINKNIGPGIGNVPLDQLRPEDRP